MTKPTGIDEAMTAILQAGLNLNIMDGETFQFRNLINDPEQQVRNFIVSPESFRTAAFTGNSQKMYAPKPDVLTIAKREQSAANMLRNKQCKQLIKAVTDFKKEFTGWSYCIEYCMVSRSGKSMSVSVAANLFETTSSQRHHTGGSSYS